MRCRYLVQGARAFRQGAIVRECCCVQGPSEIRATPNSWSVAGESDPGHECLDGGFVQFAGNEDAGGTNLQVSAAAPDGGFENFAGVVVRTEQERIRAGVEDKVGSLSGSGVGGLFHLCHGLCEGPHLVLDVGPHYANADGPPDGLTRIAVAAVFVDVGAGASA